MPTVGSRHRLEGRSPAAGQYFAPRPAVPSRPSRVPLVLPDLTVDLDVDRGVFSVAGIDPGTRYLLQEAPTPPSGSTNLLDLGCGYGPVAVALAHRAPTAAVWAVDVNQRAVALTRATAERLQLSSLHALVVPADDPLAGVPAEVGFDAVYANPPIRIGKPALHRLLTTALDRLLPGAHAYLVVQKHLGADSLAGWLTTEGWATARIGSRAGYRLLDVTARPRP